MKTRKNKLILLLAIAAIIVGVVFGILKMRSRSNAVALVSASASGNNTEVARLLTIGVPASASYSALQGLGAGEPSLVKKIPIIAAAERGHSQTIALLLQHGAAIDAVNEWGESALIVACRKNQYDAAKVLVGNGANVNIRCERGRTPLMWAVGYASPQVVSLLINNKARGGVDSVGQSMLDLASHRSEPERQQILDLIAPNRK